MTVPFLEILAATLPDRRLTTNPAVREAPRRDETAHLEPPLPIAVAFPASMGEVAAIVRLAATHGPASRVTPYFTQQRPPEFVARFPPIVHVS